MHAALKLNWVADSGTSFSKEHDVTRSMTIDAAGGTVSSSSGSGGDSKLAKQLAHGALMLLAFTVFMPLGALMARHKWVLGDTIVSGPVQVVCSAMIAGSRLNQLELLCDLAHTHTLYAGCCGGSEHGWWSHRLAAVGIPLPL